MVNRLRVWSEVSRLQIAPEVTVVVVPPPAGTRGGHIRCGCGASWFGKNAMDSYRRHWLTKHAPQQEEE